MYAFFLYPLSPTRSPAYPRLRRSLLNSPSAFSCACVDPAISRRENGSWSLRGTAIAPSSSTSSKDAFSDDARQPSGAAFFVASLTLPLSGASARPFALPKLKVKKERKEKKDDVVKQKNKGEEPSVLQHLLVGAVSGTGATCAFFFPSCRAFLLSPSSPIALQAYAHITCESRASP